MNINQDIIAINEALDRFSKASESVGYASGSIDGLLEKRDATLNKDDREAYSSLIERTDYRLDISRDEQIRAREDVQKAFEHYYSQKGGESMVTISEHVNRVIMASIHYRNRQLLFHWIMSDCNREKYHEAARKLEQQKNALLSAISKGAYINQLLVKLYHEGVRSRMATLYELTGKYHQLLDLAEDTDPTLFNDTMDSITDAIEDKAVGYAKVDKELAKDEQALKDEAQRLRERATSIGNNRRYLKQNLQEAMEETDKKKIKTPEFTIYIQNNPESLKLIDESKIPAYLTKTDIVPDKTRIKQLLKEGKDVPGAELSASSSLRIR